MSGKHLMVSVLVAFSLAAGSGKAQNCPTRPRSGSIVTNPPEIRSQNGVLNAGFTFASTFDKAGYLHECYIYQTDQGPVEAPTLRLNPGDQLILNLTNHLSYLPPAPGPAKAMQGMTGMAGTGGSQTTQANPARDACSGGTMVATSTNIHFHGLNIPPKCHQDEIISTDIENTDPPFQYNFQVPANDAPGLYWYHPHLHGEVTLQVNGGAAGALIVNGTENTNTDVSGLPERVLVIRQQFANPNSWLPQPYELTLNYQPIVPDVEPYPIIQMKPGVKEFWRVANATSQGFLALQVWFGSTPQSLELIALDGIPVKQTTNVTTINLPPAGRAEFIVQGPGLNQAASFHQIGFDTGPIGNANSAEELAAIQVTEDAKEPPAMPLASNRKPTVTPRFAGLDKLTPNTTRNIFFSEATDGSNGPTEFFMTVAGQRPKVFSMDDPPAITTTVGAVEDWTVENHTGEVHAFHIHQIHFLFLGVNGVSFANPELRDTVIVPAWSGTGPYPYVTLRMDFRDPQIAGKFVFHCHILDHEDAGMMAIIQVNPQ